MTYLYETVPEWMFEDPESLTCPMCGGWGNFIGSLGRTDWFRCRACGMDFRHDPPEED